MNYIIFSLIGLVSYSLVAPLVKLATERIPPQIAVIITNFSLVVFAIIWAKIEGFSILEHLSFSRYNLYLYVAGVFLAIGIISYYIALGSGPVSVVVPLFGLYLAVSSFVGIFVLGEQLSATKVIGLCLAIASIFLVTR